MRTVATPRARCGRDRAEEPDSVPSPEFAHRVLAWTAAASPAPQVDFNSHEVHASVANRRTSQLQHLSLLPPLVTSAKPVEEVSAPPTVEPKKSPATASPPASRAWSVRWQLGSRKAQADQLAATLGKRGYSARVDGTTAPFRVRMVATPVSGTRKLRSRRSSRNAWSASWVRAP